MAIQFTSPSDESVFHLLTPVEFKGKSDNKISQISFFAGAFWLGDIQPVSGEWVFRYPGFNQAGRRTIKAVGHDASGAEVESASIEIVLSNMSAAGFEPGIDVSDFDGFVDWVKVRNAGYSFAFAKATEGGTFRASTFSGNWTRIKGAGLIRGAYHFFRPTVDPVVQAKHFLKTVADVDPLEPDDLPPVLDLEHFPKSVEAQWASLQLSDRVKRVKQWIDHVEEALQRKPMIYTSYGFWDQFMKGVTDFASYPLWVANYTSKPQPALPTPWKSWQFWQFTDSTEVPGIPNPAEDGNRFNGSISDLEKFIKSTRHG